MPVHQGGPTVASGRSKGNQWEPTPQQPEEAEDGKWEETEQVRRSAAWILGGGQVSPGSSQEACPVLRKCSESQTYPLPKLRKPVDLAPGMGLSLREPPLPAGAGLVTPATKIFPVLPSKERW